MANAKRRRRIRLGLLAGLAAALLVAGPAHSAVPAKPPKPKVTAASDQYAPPAQVASSTARAAAVGKCKRAVGQQFIAKKKAAKTKAQLRRLQRDELLAKKQCEKLGKGR